MSNRFILISLIVMSGVGLAAISLLAINLLLPGGAEGVARVAVAGETEQAQATSDGVVTVEEYDSAIERARDCVEQRGFRAEIDPRDRMRMARLRIEILDADGVPDRDTVDGAHGAISGCLLDNVSAVADEWRRQHTPSNEEIVDLYSRLGQCVVSGGPTRGIVVPSDLEFVDYGPVAGPLTVGAEDFLTYAACALELQSETGFVPPMPSTD